MKYVLVSGGALSLAQASEVLVAVRGRKKGNEGKEVNADRVICSPGVISGIGKGVIGKLWSPTLFPSSPVVSGTGVCG